MILKRYYNTIEIDSKFRQSMKTDRKATYGSLDTASIKRNEKRQRKTSKEISEQSSSSVLQIQHTSDIPLDGSFSPDLEGEPVSEPNKRSHKRVIKTGVELFLPADFILHEKLVAAVRRTNISPANLVTFFYFYNFRFRFGTCFLCSSMILRLS